MRGSLRSRGIYIQRHRIIDSMRRVDPVSQSIRRRVLTYRREYSVPGPNCLWWVLSFVQCLYICSSKGITGFFPGLRLRQCRIVGGCGLGSVFDHIKHWGWYIKRKLSLVWKALGRYRAQSAERGRLGRTLILMVVAYRIPCSLYIRKGRNQSSLHMLLIVCILS